jgi:hypothetical protein
MKKLTLAFLVATLILAPVFAAAQTGGGPSRPQAPAGSPSDRLKSSPSTGQTTPPRDTPRDPAASPASPTRDAPYWMINTQADCEKAGGTWTREASPSCSKK